MARKVEFDEAVALKRAMRLFWQKGYESTSIQDLVETLGINRFSLYNSFGDKKALFIQALELYHKTVLSELLKPLKSEGLGKQKLDDYLAFMQAKLESKSGLLGCFVQNSSLSSVAQHQDVSRVLRDMCGDLSASIESAIQQSINEGDMMGGERASVLAGHILCQIQGLIVLRKSLKSINGIGQQVRFLRQQVSQW